MSLHPLPDAARRRPSLTFGLVGGAFALLFVLASSAGELADGSYVPSGPVVGLVVGGFVGGVLLARVLWTRLDATRSPLRGTLVGALVGLLAMPIPFYLLEAALVVIDGVPFEPQLGANPLESAFLLLAAPLLLGALGVFATWGGTVLVGGVTGYLLARR